LTFHRRQRLEAILAYGGRCVCCSESEPTFLVFDHVADDGAEHRRETGKGGTSFVNWLHANGFPDTIQLLCHNCNHAKRLGVCPHQIGTVTV
jgi:hypothetical protein